MTPEMFLTFQDARAYVSLVERFIDGIGVVAESATILCDSRNSLQWHIMSLPPASQLGAIASHVTQSYETYRIALMIFGVGVVFPLPPQSAPLPKLVRLLRLELQSSPGIRTELSSSSAKSNIHLWYLFMGGIAATGTQEREWYVDELRRFCEHDAVSISTWDEAREILKSVLWLDTACDSGGKDLWNEIRGTIG